jgi:hypothetical protein
MMDEQEQRAFVRFLAKRLKKYCRELWVHQAFAANLRVAGYEDVDAIIEGIRNLPEIQDELDRQFSWLDELVPQADEQNQEKALQEYLEKWKPTGDPN